MAIAPLAPDPLMPGVVELPILLPVPEEVEGVVFSIVEPVALLPVPECESLILDEVLGEVDELLPVEPDVLGDVSVPLPDEPDVLGDVSDDPLPVELEPEPLPVDWLWAYAGTKQAATPKASRVRRKVYFFICLPLL